MLYNKIIEIEFLNPNHSNGPMTYDNLNSAQNDGESCKNEIAQTLLIDRNSSSHWQQADIRGSKATSSSNRNFLTSSSKTLLSTKIVSPSGIMNDQTPLLLKQFYPSMDDKNGTFHSNNQHQHLQDMYRSTLLRKSQSQQQFLSQQRSQSHVQQPKLQKRSPSVPSVLEYVSTLGNDDNGTNESVSSSNINFGSRCVDSVKRSIRFQVIIWHIGQIDMVQGRVPMTFRVTIFWNAPIDFDNDDVDDENNDNALSNNLIENDHISISSSCNRTNATNPTFKMQGRQQAIITETNETASKRMDVPAVSILNVETFNTIGEPEVSLLNESTKLMRWSCMYRAVVFEENWTVDQFPHDEHVIQLKLAILANRQSSCTWDRTIWKLGLATEHDNQGAVRIPHGMIVDHVTIPEFSYKKEEGITFHICPLDHGSSAPSNVDSPTMMDSKMDGETCLIVKLNVIRNSGYYDRNIMPLLGMLNLVAVSIKFLEKSKFFERALLTLNIAFVEINMRMTCDAKLPSASYQIKMQRILNEYFFCLLLIVLESLLVYQLDKRNFKVSAEVIDVAAACLVLVHNVGTLYFYYSEANRIRKKITVRSNKPQLKTGQ